MGRYRNEARHQPGTFALPGHLVMELLDSTCAEIARNGFDKIVIINGHGGTENLIRYFIQTQLERRRSYAVYFFEPSSDSAYSAQLKKNINQIWKQTSTPVKEKHQRCCT